ncbi:MAG: ribonuclease H-like domain-containing protein [bacterium]
MLRRKVERINSKYAGAAPALPRPAPPRYPADEVIDGEVVETPSGRHFQTVKLWERHRRHGSLDIIDLQQLPEDLLGPLSNGECSPSPVTRWAFLDTETTGLAGGSGTYAFLIGVGSVSEDGFSVRQFFMRDYEEEPSLLEALSEHLARFDVLVTYNGKTYDQPLLETRYRMCRMRPPFSRMQHLDLLHGARRLWKLRLESCRLVDLENQILGVEREGDVPGELIPFLYFEYLRTKQAFRLIPVFHHNAIDILTTACLTAIVPWAFRDPSSTRVSHGADLVGIARWLAANGEREQAIGLMRRAVEIGLPDALLFRTLWDTACLEKKRGCEDAALSIFAELAQSPNPYRVAALEALAKHYEHRERNYARALEMVASARAVGDSEELARRQARLEKRLAAQSQKAARLL